MKNRGVFSAIFSNVKPARRNAVAGGLFSFARKTSLIVARAFFVVSLLIISSKLNVFANTGQAVDSWVSMANTVPTGSGAGACIVYAEQGGKGKVYNLRGGGNLFGIYDIETNVFISTTNLPFSAATGAAMTWDGGNFLYLLGGGTNFYQYDITASTFTSLEPPPASVGGGGAIIYVSTQAGFNFCYAYQGGTNVFWRYDINASSWVTRQNQTAATGAGASLLWAGDEYIYGFIGGSNAGFRRYNINTNAAWASLANTPQTIGAGGSLTWDGVITSSNIYAFRGNSDTPFFKYNISSNAWVYVSSAPLTIGSNSGNRLARSGEYIYGRRALTTDDFWSYRWRDVDAPGQVTGFAAATGTNPGEINLSWVSPGNDGYTGNLPVGSTFYIQYASWTGVNFSTDTRPPTGGYDISIPTGPITPGTSVYYTKTGLSDGVTYYFRIWVQDNAGNYSSISTGATAWAQVSPEIPAPPSWVAGEIVVTTNTIKWVLKNEHNDTVEIFVSTDTDTDSRITGAELGQILTTATTSWLETGLSSNTAYTRYGEAYIATGSSWTSALTRYTLAYPPAAPTATALSYDKINVSWAFSGASKYSIARSVDDFATPWSTAAVILSPGTTHQDTGLSANTSYKYRIYAVNGDDVVNTALHSGDSAAALTYPAAPTAFGAQNVYITSVTWSWTASAGGADGYRVYMASSPSTMAADVAAATVYNEVNLGPNAEYGRFAVAYNATGESLASNETTTYTMSAAPTALEITEVFSSSVTLSWTDGVNPAGTRYGIARDGDSGFADSTTFYAFSDGLTATTTAATGLGGGATYYFRMWAFNNSQAVSAYSNSTGTIMPPAPPAAPDGLYGLAVSTTVIKWEWDITTNATYYRIYNTVGDALIENLDGNGNTTYIEVALSSNTQYSRYVKAGNDQGLSGASGTASRYTLAYPPTTLTATATSSSTINTSWNGSGAYNYELRRSSDGFASFVVSTITAQTNFSGTNLTAGVTYWHRVYAVNHDSITTTAIYSPEVSTRTWPAPVVSLSSSAATTTSITWEWTAAVGADGYLILMASSPGTALGQVDAAQTSFVSTNLSTNTAYGRVVRAYNTSGAGAVSPSATFYTLAAVPGTPVVDGVTTNSVSLSWASGGNPSGTRYGVARSTDDFATVVTTVSAYSDALTTAYTTVGGLSQNTTYQFRVWAFNGDATATAFTTSVSTKTKRTNIIDNESFEGTFPPDGWWTNHITTGAIQNGTQKRTGAFSVQFDNASDVLRTPLLDAPAAFTFWLYATAGATDFKVERATNATTGPWTALSGTPITADLGGAFVQQTFDLSSFTNIYIRFYRGGLKTYYLDDVNVAMFVPDTTPPAPISNLTALAGVSEGQLNLRWTSPSGDDGASVALSGGYIIKYSSVQIINSADFNAPAFAHGSVTVSTSVAVGTEVGYTLSLTPGASYWVAIKSTDSAGNLSSWTSSADNPLVNTLAYGWAYDAAPAAPANLAATASDNSVMLTWDAVAAADLSHYELFYSSTAPYDFSDNLVATATVNTTFIHTGLVDHVTHHYKVRAVDLPPSVLYGAFSNIVSTFPRPSAPFAPALAYDLSATTTDSIKWTLTDNASNETGLHISSAVNTGARLWSSAGLASTGGTTSWIESGFGANEAVTRYAEASNAIGSAWSASLTRYTRALPPSTLAADAVYFSSVTLSWSANGNLGSPKYEISISSDKFSVFFATPIALAANHTAVTADISGLVGGATYWVRARAYNGDNVASVFSSTMSFITARVPTDYLKIANAGFELASLSGWTPNSTSITRNTTIKRSGAASCKFDDPTLTFSGRTITSSTSTVVGGNNYSVGAWFYVAPDNGVVSGTQVQIGIVWIDNAGAVIYTSTSTGLTLSAFSTWEKLSYSDVAPASAVGAVMSIAAKYTTGNQCDVYVDDVDYAPDTIAPGAITDLAAAKGTNAGEINLTWTAVGDDGYAENNGASASYILKYATYPLVAASSWTWYNNANAYFQQWTVSPVSATENKTLSLSPGVTYYFTIVTFDAAGNMSNFDVKTMETPQASAIAMEGRAGGSVVINEINCSKSPNWIEFYNPSTFTVVMDNWEVFEIAESSASPVKTYGTFSLPSGHYLVLYFDSAASDSSTPYTASGDTYYKTYTANTGLTATDNAIVLKNASGVWIDAVFYTDGSGSLTNSTRYKAALNYAVADNHWTSPVNPSDEDIEKLYTASSRYLKSGVSLARDDKSTDGTNPSKAEWHIHATPTPGAPTEGYKNQVPDTTPPSQIVNLAASTGDNRGTINLSWTAPGEDGALNTAQLYIVRYSPNVIANDTDFDNAEVKYNDKSFTYALDSNVSESITWNPSAPGTAQNYALGSLTPGVTYYIAVKTEDEQPNRSLLSNVVTLFASNSIGSNVRINEVAPMETNDWVELYNATTNQVDMGGWEICANIEGSDLSGVIEAGSDYTILKTIPTGFILPATSYVVLNMGYASPPADETASDTNGNGYRDLYSASSIVDTDGVIFIRNKNKTFVDSVAYSDGVGSEPAWTLMWKWLNGHRQWSPATASSADAADWSAASGGKIEGRTFGRNSFSDDTDDTAAAKNDWKIYPVPTKGAQNDDVPPAAITNLSALANPDVEGRIDLTWTAPGDDGIVGNNSGGYYMVKYATYSVDTSSLAWWNSISTTTVSNINKGWKIKSPPSAVGSTETQTLTGLYPGTAYYFAVRTVDDVANWSALDLQIGAADPAVQAQAVATNLPPEAPVGVAVSAGNRTAALSWLASAALDIKEYRISSNTVNNFADAGTTLAAVVSSATITFDASGLLNGVTYYFWIQSTDLSNLTGSTSAVVSAMPIISPPSALTSSHKGDRVELSWTASPDAAAGNFAGYSIYRSSVSVSSGFNLVASLTGGGSTTHYDTSAVVAAQTYYYFMRSSDTAGPESFATSVSTAVPDDKGPLISPASPTSSTVTVAVKGSKIIIEAAVADDTTTPYISGVNSGTVSVAYSTAAAGVTTNLALDIVENSDSYAGARLLSATFRKELTAATAGISAQLQSILTDGGTFYFFFYAVDNVANYTVGAVTYTVIIQTEQKTSAAVTASAGGEVTLSDGNPDDGETSVTIPAGALSADVTITIEQADPASSGITPASVESTIDTDVNSGRPIAVYIFGPEGTIFAKPVTITLLYFEDGGVIKDIDGLTIAGATEDDLRIYRWDGVEWRFMGGTVDKIKNTVSTKVSHFSMYALFNSKGAPPKPVAMEKFITPNSDGINDRLEFDGAADDFKEITIYDINGRVIRKLQGESSWDARDENGKIVEIGAYIWRAVYTNGTANYGAVVVAK